MSLQILTDRVKNILGTDSGLNATVKFKTEEGNVFIDSKSVPNAVTNDDLEADCTFEVSTKNALKLIDGDLNAMMAYMTGKLKIDGDMSVAMRIAETFGGK
ncbi:SCP2 sterol-binding domain-containing protein [Dyadobacter fanqingshengii]|uniref:SCP2 sterol-binding domain-containing protein n=1 Tax=Dyadobacter fanqingshengii TaxID=2906443 RepID=A0A9X1T8S9_9BACT|nr:SCP2 sterol-binding domain-containing protein [Dyadobacter fanqingshengii]MCF0039214.1 SCP2 sterol-binding domain-containing protein [Dyadobacter fanqingshengii]MCF2503245.1 SCP2 sterol-binding domain-containing protein [Dyadobacter fanqingshengii]USJ33967.1 SCP2 sterol-binding domain-containing protein [Dyadobacter fanqingshengii]